MSDVLRKKCGEVDCEDHDCDLCSNAKAGCDDEPCDACSVIGNGNVCQFEEA